MGPPKFWILTLKLTCVLITLNIVTVKALDCMFTGCTAYKGIVLGDYVDCSSLNLADVPAPTSPCSNPIYELKLNNNSIRSLGNNILPDLIITKIDFSNNPIRSVDNSSFLSLGKYLKILILSGDSSSEPPVNAFNPLVQVEDLTLRNYNVPHIYNTNKYFLPFPKLRNVTLDNWKLVSIDSNSTSTLLSLTLMNQPMQILPVDYLHSVELRNLQKLQISGTNINTVSHTVFSDLNNIQILNLSNNQIDILESYCFSGIEDTLIKLSLSNNILTGEASKFSGLANLINLEELDLSSNNIVTIPNLALLQTTKPLKLYMRNNSITSITANAFVDVADKLYCLDLSLNRIESIDANAFNRVPYLQTLYLSHQIIVSGNSLVLPASLTQSVATLRELYVDGHGVTSSSWSIIQQLTMLEVLNLGSTQISIANKSLINLKKLKYLDISYNNLNTVTQAMLAGPKDTLKFLSLTGNSISKLSSCIFYKFTSYPITMDMGMNRLTCDCAVTWLWNNIKNGKIIFTPGQEVMCSDNQLLASKNINDFCASQFQEPQCYDYYSSPTLSIYLKGSNPSFTVSWQLSDSSDLKNITIVVTNSHSSKPVFQNTVTASTTSATFNIPDNTTHFVCIIAYFYSLSSISNCTETIAQTTTEHQGGLDQEKIGIIIGVVIGGVVLLAIVVAIVYLVFFRRNNKKDVPSNVPVQPRNFSKSELPSMNEETRTFSKPKKPRGPGVPEHRDGMQVVAISDGQISNGRVGRAHLLNSDGSFKTSGSSKPSSTSSQSSQVNYENDHRPLPPTPSSDSSTHYPAGYYNMGYKDDKYDEIPYGKESNL